MVLNRKINRKILKSERRIIFDLREFQTPISREELKTYLLRAFGSFGNIRVMSVRKRRIRQ